MFSIREFSIDLVSLNSCFQPQTGIYTQSHDDLTSSSGSCDSSPHLGRNFPEIRKEVQTKSVAVQTESCEKVGAKPKVNSDLSALYLSFILMLIGFNFSAFVTSFQHHINGKNILEIKYKIL